MIEESEHDQLVRLKERVKIFKEWLPTQHYHSDVDEYQVWEDLKNETYQKVEDHFDFVFGTKGEQTT
jgi:hypothetical protein